MDAALTTRCACSPGVAASGGACEYDATTGRPTAIVVNWAMPLSDLLLEPMEALVQRHRALVWHEARSAVSTLTELPPPYRLPQVPRQVFHGLGWIFSAMHDADLLVARAMTDVDGRSETAWTFDPRTALNVMVEASAFYNCSDPVLALMKHPELGRDSHMSLLTARQSVMSYSWDKRVDALTLAVFADLGWYQVHWERADCTNTWGKNQARAPTPPPQQRPH